MPNTITDILVRESGRIGTDIYNRNFATSPWIHLLPRGEFPAGMGETISVLTYERNAPDVAAPVWQDVAIVDGAEGGACLQAADEVTIGSTVRTYNLKRRVLKGPKFCAEEQRPVFALRDQLDSIVQILAERTRLEWETRNRHEYLRLCKHKVVVNASTQATDSTGLSSFSGMTIGTPAYLGQGVLDKWKTKLMRDGAGQSAMGKADGAPVLTLMIGSEASEALIRANADIRDDLRWGNPGELLKQIGVERSYRGFFHVIDPYPIRYSVDGNTLTEVNPFVSSAASKGTKYDINPDWENPAVASVEVGFIYDRAVMQQLIPRPITNPHPKFKFDPVNYMGDWALLNILSEQDNPRGQIVFHHGILAAGSKPIHPERGVAFLFKRCDPAPLTSTTCPTS